MKNGLFFILGATWMTASALAGFKLPMSVYRTDKMDKAQSIAREKGQPVAFLYSDENTGCGICARSSLKMVDELKMRCVIVYVCAHTNLTGLPIPVIGALSSPESGMTIPKTIVMDSNLEKVLIFIPYAKDEALDDLLKKAKKTLAPAKPNRRSTLEAMP